MNITRRHAAVATAALVLLLTGCTGTTSAPPSTSQTPSSQSEPSSAPPAAGDQSKADACAIVQGGLKDFVALSGKVDASDPEGVRDAFSDFVDAANSDLETITNAELQPSAAKLTDAYNHYVDYLDAIVTDSTKAAEMDDPIENLQTVITEISTTCAS